MFDAEPGGTRLASDDSKEKLRLWIVSAPKKEKAKAGAFPFPFLSFKERPIGRPPANERRGRLIAGRPLAPAFLLSGLFSFLPWSSGPRPIRWRPIGAPSSFRFGSPGRPSYRIWKIRQVTSSARTYVFIFILSGYYFAWYARCGLHSQPLTPREGRN